MANGLWKRMLAMGVCGVLGMGLLVSGLWLMQRPLPAAEAHLACELPPVTATPSKVGLYVLAYDNNPQGQFDLGVKYDETVAGLVEATRMSLGTIVVILADLGEVGDTHLIIGYRGVGTRVDCLPTADGALDPSLNELDTADGQSLANFLVWGRDTFATGSSGLVFSYIGHGNPVVPYTDPGINEIVPSGEMSGVKCQVSGECEDVRTLSPLPSRLGVNPSFTDHHAPVTGTLSLITPYDLSVALAAATNNGASPFDLVDLLHCFAASVDELVEIAPYATAIVASPNYAFFDPAMPGATFLEDSLLNVLVTYDSFHPITGHPHILMGVEADTVVDITNSWQGVTDELLEEFDRDEVGTAERLFTAYQNSVKYDTTVCEQNQDWELAPPDALSDMASLAQEMQVTFSGRSPTLTAALDATINQLDGTILVAVAQSGVPYFSESGESWEFLPDKSGVSLFTPFQTVEIEGEQYLPWQSLWYTGTTSYQLGEDVEIVNSQPFLFIKEQEQKTWADVIDRYWRVQGMRPGVDVNTFFCTAELLGMGTDAADLAVEILTPLEGVTAGERLDVEVTVQNRVGVTATGVVLEFWPDESAGWLSFAGEETGICEAKGAAIVCEFAQILPASEQTVVLQFDTDVDGVLVPTALTLEAQVTAETFEPRVGDNRQVVVVAVRPDRALVYLPVVVR